MTTSKTWYLPHHTVLNPNKPGKVCLVFDAASKFDGVSLTDKLLTGPDLLNNLVAILMKFHRGKIGVLADWNKCFIKSEFVKKIETLCASCGGT